MTPTSPRLRLGRGHQPLTPNQQAFRTIAAAAFLTNPFTAALHLLIVITVRLLLPGRIKGWIILTIGIIIAAAALSLGAAHAYAAPYIDIYQHILATFPHTTDGLWPWVRTNLPGWLIGQTPLAIPLALITSGAYLAIRDYYTDDWREGTTREKPLRPRDIERAKTQQNKTIATQGHAPSVNHLTLALGIDANTGQAVEIRASELRTHGVIVGATGLGKTQTLTRILHGFTAAPAAQRLRLPLVIINMKPDPDLTDYLAAIAHTTGRAFHHITTDPATSTTGYNPLDGLTEDEIADTIYETVFASDTTTNLHYATLSRRLLQNAATALHDLATHNAHKAGTTRAWRQDLHDLQDLLNIKTLRHIHQDLTPTPAARLGSYLADLDDTDTTDLGDIRDRLAIITHTRAGQILTGPLTLQRAIEDGDITLFSLDAAGSPETARTIGRLAIQDLTATFGRLGARRWGQHMLCPVLLDEFSALQTPKVADLYARARAAGAAVLLSTQDLDADLTSVSTEFAAQVRTNANIWLLMRQTRGDMAESVAHDLGSRAAWKETVQVQDDWDPLGGIHAAAGVGSLREVEEFILHPNDIKSLPQGGAYLIVKVPANTLNTHTAHTRIQRIHVNAPPRMTTITYHQHANKVPSPQETTVPSQHDTPSHTAEWAYEPPDDA